MCEYVWDYMNENEENDYFRNEAQKSHLKVGALSIDNYENAVVLPWKPGAGWGLGGIVCNGEFIEKSMKIPRENVASKFGGGISGK